MWRKESRRTFGDPSICSHLARLLASAQAEDKVPEASERSSIVWGVAHQTENNEGLIFKPG
jgi:hypothetical protein